ncbi:LOW QUALITY PROTEIN: tripartite motif-containing protein 35-like [Thalassophryne amazonica]|uniref:LOW QUALITY PROTEIN: tripartite motif-containing protein 35-like n=1 Tax=Thalassophryne amazonica TaxID=390379 RepID=UPI00147114CC|nr:LOW QUALITY PROTEIN: tripartite motif-containing protein 35-like [Thalassophryne amazonica]
MAGRLSLPELDLSCSICCDIFRDPVVLKCSHSFCAGCLQRYWAQRGRNRDCPLCRSRCVDEPVTSLSLRNLCQFYLEEGGEDLGATGGEGEELRCEPGEACSLHEERLKLFCQVDQEPICVVCHTSRKHKGHSCCPVSEAAAGLKEKMRSALSSLQEKKESFDKMKKNYENAAAEIQAQARLVERRTREEFERLHSFLQAEEAARMEALREEEEQKSRAMMQKIEEINRNIARVSESIRTAEEEMNSDDIFLLHKCKHVLSSISCPVEDPVMDPGALVDVAKHLGSLSFHVWEKMHDIVKYTPVTLDPNTAAPWLRLSDDLTSVSDNDDKQKLPDVPERFDPDTAVLGHQGYTSGRHAWEVDVGENTAWVVGVAKESVQRKEKLPSVLKNGYLTVYFYHKMYFAGTSPLTRLNLKKNLQRVRVQLDCEKGRVCFWDAQDNAHIYTYKHAIAEKVFPYFVGCKQSPLKIEPLEVSVRAVEHQ